MLKPITALAAIVAAAVLLLPTITHAAQTNAVRPAHFHLS
jgi:hypothetical protein